MVLGGVVGAIDFPKAERKLATPEAERKLATPEAERKLATPEAERKLATPEAEELPHSTATAGHTLPNRLRCSACGLRYSSTGGQTASSEPSAKPKTSRDDGAA